MKLIRFISSLTLYWIGDILSRTILYWGDGYGYRVYQKVMLWSVDLDKEGKIWKHVKRK